MPAGREFPLPWAMYMILGVGLAVGTMLGPLACDGPEIADCVDSADCQLAFGVGAVCQSDGYCAQVDLPDRCQRTTPSDVLQNPRAYADAVVVGSLYNSRVTDTTQLAVELPFRQIVGLPNLFGFPVALVSCDYAADDRYDSLSADDALLQVTNYLLDDLQVPAIIGPGTSSRVQATFPLTRDAQAVLISASATSPELTDIDGTNHTDATPGLLWRTAPSDLQQAEVMAQHIIDAGLGEITIVAQEGTYGATLSDALAELLRPVTNVNTYVFDTTTFGSTLAEASLSGFDTFVFVSSDLVDAVGLLNAVGGTPELSERFVGRLLLFSDGAYDRRLITDTLPVSQDLLPTVAGTRPAPSGGLGYNSFILDFSRAYERDPDDSAYAAYSYDAAWMVLYGIAWSHFNEDDVTGPGIAKGMRMLSAGQEQLVGPSSWQPIQASFEAGIPVDIIGASSPLDFDPATEETTGIIEFWTVVDTANGFELQSSYTVSP